MILETIVSTVDNKGEANFAPFGIKRSGQFIFISPYIPSKTLSNLDESGYATVNYTNDATFFVNCIIGEKKFQKKKCSKINGYYLKKCLSHDEVIVDSIKKDNIRPTYKCKIVSSYNHNRFLGFNRAQSSIIEACIIASRVGILNKKKVLADLDFLEVSVNKTAGSKEFKLWEKIRLFINKEIREKN